MGHADREEDGPLSGGGRPRRWSLLSHAWKVGRRYGARRSAEALANRCCVATLCLLGLVLLVSACGSAAPAEEGGEESLGINDLPYLHWSGEHPAGTSTASYSKAFKLEAGEVLRVRWSLVTLSERPSDFLLLLGRGSGYDKDHPSTDALVWYSSEGGGEEASGSKDVTGGEPGQFDDAYYLEVFGQNICWDVTIAARAGEGADGGRSVLAATEGRTTPERN